MHWDRSGLRSLQPVAGWLIVVVIVLTIDYLFPTNVVKAIVHKSLLSIEAPVQSALTWAGAPIRWVSYNETGLQRIADLENRLHITAVERAHLERLEDEVYSLSALAKLPVPETLPPVFLVTTLHPRSDHSILNAGTTAGITSGMMVTDESGVLIGMVTEVGRFTSRVELRSNEGTAIGVKTAAGSSPGVLRVSRASASIEEVLQTASLSEGDVVVTDGTGGYPAGVVVGQVTAVYGEAAEITKSGTVELLAHRDGLVKVY